MLANMIQLEAQKTLELDPSWLFLEPLLPPPGREAQASLLDGDRHKAQLLYLPGQQLLASKM